MVPHEDRLFLPPDTRLDDLPYEYRVVSLGHLALGYYAAPFNAEILPFLLRHPSALLPKSIPGFHCSWLEVLPPASTRTGPFEGGSSLKGCYPMFTNY